MQAREEESNRAPVDYIAYSQYTANQGSADINNAFVESMVPAVRESLDHLDILTFVPKADAWPVEIEADSIRPVGHDYRDENWPHERDVEWSSELALRQSK